MVSILTRKKKAIQKHGLASHIPQERILIGTTQNPHTPCRWTNNSQKKIVPRLPAKMVEFFGGREGTKKEEKLC